jgi:hypothetical protein
MSLRFDAIYQKRRTPIAKAAGVPRRVIEGEGLGGFARRSEYQRRRKRVVPAVAIIFLVRSARRFPGLRTLFWAARGPHARAPVPRRCGSAKFPTQIDALAAGQDHIAGENAQMSLRITPALDDIGGSDREPLGQTALLAIG